MRNRVRVQAPVKKALEIVLRLLAIVRQFLKTRPLLKTPPPMLQLRRENRLQTMVRNLKTIVFKVRIL